MAARLMSWSLVASGPDTAVPKPLRPCRSIKSAVSFRSSKAGLLQTSDVDLKELRIRFYPARTSVIR